MGGNFLPKKVPPKRVLSYPRNWRNKELWEWDYFPTQNFEKTSFTISSLASPDEVSLDASVQAISPNADSNKQRVKASARILLKMLFIYSLLN